VDADHPGLIAKFGGHAMAAGLTLAADGLDRFAAAIDAVGNKRLHADMLTGYVMSDGELHGQNLTREVAELLRAAGPWGQGFPEPTFDGVFTVLERRIVGQRHLKLDLRARDTATTISAIAFNRADFECAPRDTLRLVYRLDVDDYGSRRSIQLVVEHLERTDGA